MKKELLQGLSEEQIAKVAACHNSDEIFELAEQEGVELTPEQLKAVSGGCGGSDKKDDEEKSENVDPQHKNPNINPF